MARHSLDNFNFDSPIIATAGPAKPRVYLVRALSTEEFWDLAPVRHRYHSLADCPHPVGTCPQRPYDIGRRVF